MTDHDDSGAQLPPVVAIVQSAPVLGDVEHNLDSILADIAKAAEQGAGLVVFPECALSGYMLDRQEAAQAAQPVSGQVVEALASEARRLGITAVVGMLTHEGDRLFNSAMVLRPDGSTAQYHKAHLPRLGVDEFCTPGDTGFAATATPVGNIGLLICYDLRFPEAARTLALAGAELLVVLANWPSRATDYPSVFTRARAAENRLPLVVSSRVGVERGASYLGHSQAVLPDGTVVDEAGSIDEQMLIVRFDAELLRSTRSLATKADGPGGLLADRRPELYRAFTNGSVNEKSEGVQRDG